MSDVAISIQEISKVYKMYNKPMDRLKESLHLLRKKYHKDFHALKQISFDIKQGETLGIIGKNGSGKSTLLKIITGVLTPSTGTVYVKGRIAALLELGAGFNPDYTGLENVFLNGTIMGYSKQEMETKLQNIIDFADIGDFMHQPVKMYSSGMFARLAFAVAISVDPEILIVDESLSVGDIGFQAKCFAKFREFQEQGKTIIFVTHEMDAVFKYCSRGIVLHNGKIIADDSPKNSIDIYKKLLVNADLSEDKSKTIEEKTMYYKEQSLSKSFSISPVCEIYGNRKASIIDFGILDDQHNPVQKLIFDHNYRFIMKVKFNEEIVNPIFTYTIRDLTGMDLTGTNTMLNNLYTGRFLAGESVEIIFTHKMNLNTGNYLLTFACSGYEKEEFVVYERLYHIILFEVVSFKKFVGITDLGSKIDIRREINGGNH